MIGEELAELTVAGLVSDESANIDTAPLGLEQLRDVTKKFYASGA